MENNYVSMLQRIYCQISMSTWVPSPHCSTCQLKTSYQTLFFVPTPTKVRWVATRNRAFSVAVLCLWIVLSIKASLPFTILSFKHSFVVILCTSSSLRAGLWISLFGYLMLFACSSYVLWVILISADWWWLFFMISLYCSYFESSLEQAAYTFSK